VAVTGAFLGRRSGGSDPNSSSQPLEPTLTCFPTPSARPADGLWRVLAGAGLEGSWRPGSDRLLGGVGGVGGAH